MVVPLVLLRYIQINKRQKIALAAIFSVGGFIIAFAILRIAMINPATNQADPIWLAFWTVLESTVAIIVCSLPTFRSLIGHKKDKQVAAQPVATIRDPGRRRRRGIDDPLDDTLDDDDNDNDELEISSTDLSRDGTTSLRKSRDHFETAYTAFNGSTPVSYSNVAGPVLDKDMIHVWSARIDPNSGIDLEKNCKWCTVFSLSRVETILIGLRSTI